MTQNITVKLSSVSTDLTEKFDALFPTWTSVVATVLATLILMLVLGKFVYHPVKKMVRERKQYIQNNIDEAIKHNKEAVVDREKANDELEQAHIRAAEIISQAKLDAEKIKADQLESAKSEAHKIIVSAQSEFEREKSKFEQESKQAIVDVALAAAQKVLEKEVDSSTNKKMIEEFVKASK